MSRDGQTTGAGSSEQESAAPRDWIDVTQSRDCRCLWSWVLHRSKVVVTVQQLGAGYSTAALLGCMMCISPLLKPSQHTNESNRRKRFNMNRRSGVAACCHTTTGCTYTLMHTLTHSHRTGSTDKLLA